MFFFRNPSICNFLQSKVVFNLFCDIDTDFSRHLMASNCLKWLNAQNNCPLPIHRDLPEEFQADLFPIKMVSEF